MYEVAKSKTDEGYLNLFRVLARWSGRPTADAPDHYIIEKYYPEGNEFFPLTDLNSVDGIRRFISIADVQWWINDIKRVQPLTYLI